MLPGLPWIPGSLRSPRSMGSSAWPSRRRSSRSSGRSTGTATWLQPEPWWRASSARTMAICTRRSLRCSPCRLHSDLPYLVAVGGWFLGRLAVLIAGVAQQTRALSQPDRILVAIAAITFVPTLHDLLLGNVSILIAAVVAIIAWSDDGYAPGLVMGVVLATVPKPALIPILVWMLVYRRRAFLCVRGLGRRLLGGRHHPPGRACLPAPGSRCSSTRPTWGRTRPGISPLGRCSRRSWPGP